MIELPASFLNYKPQFLMKSSVFLSEFEGQQLLGATEFSWAYEQYTRRSKRDEENDGVIVKILVPYPDQLKPLVCEDLPYTYLAVKDHPVFHLPAGTIPAGADGGLVEEFYFRAYQIMEYTGALRMAAEYLVALKEKGYADDDPKVLQTQEESNELRGSVFKLGLLMREALRRAQDSSVEGQA